MRRFCRAVPRVRLVRPDGQVDGCSHRSFRTRGQFGIPPRSGIFGEWIFRIDDICENVICCSRHEKLIVGTKFQASASWDGTVKVWDLYKSNSTPETFESGADVVCVAFRPDGSQVCSGTIRGLLRFWNVEDGSLVCEIDGQKDIKGGML